MKIRPNRPIFNRPTLGSGSKDEKDYIRAFVLSNELSRLEYEMKMIELRMTSVKSRIEEIQVEIYSINSLFKEKEGLTNDEISPEFNKKHVTMEY